MVLDRALDGQMSAHVLDERLFEGEAFGGILGLVVDIIPQSDIPVEMYLCLFTSYVLLLSI